MSMIPSSPLGRAGIAAAQAGAHSPSPAARQALDGATTLGAVNPTQLAQHIQRLPDAAARRQLLDEVAPHLPPRDLQDVQRELGQSPGKPQEIDADLALDLAQIGLDIAGIFDPTPISDGANTLISLGRGDWLGAGLSAVSMIPYVGDAAKLGKLGKYAQTVAKAIGDAIAKLPLDKLPESARKQLTTLNELTGIFAKESDTAARTALRAADDVPTTGAARAGAAASRVGAQPAWGKYLNDIKAQTGLAVSPKQQKLIDQALAKTDYTRLSVAESKAHRAQFNKVKNELITQWKSRPAKAGRATPKTCIQRTARWCAVRANLMMRTTSSKAGTAAPTSGGTCTRRAFPTSTSRAFTALAAPATRSSVDPIP